MPRVKDSLLQLSRRSVLAGASTAPLLPALDVSAPLLTAPNLAALAHPFDRWVAEAYALMDAACRLPETPEGPRDEFFRRADALEKLIVLTPCLDEPAIRAKFGYLRWTLRNGGDDDDLVALDHIGEFLRRHCTGPWTLYTPR